MGRITEITPRVSIETRRTSAAFIIDQAGVDSDDAAGRIEFDYRDVFALRQALDTILRSPAFLLWLEKQEGHAFVPPTPSTDLVAQLADALKTAQFGLAPEKCPACAGWEVEKGRSET